jgi:hypothetical protein
MLSYFIFLSAKILVDVNGALKHNLEVADMSKFFSSVALV